MPSDRASGIALIAGFAAMIVTMSLHPAGTIAQAELEPIVRRSIAVHAMALASLPLLFLGTLGLSRRLGFTNLAISGLVVYGFALAAAMSAAVFSGLVMPPVFRQIVSSAGEQNADAWRMISQFGHFVNQAYAQVYVAASSAAIAIWSAAAWRRRQLERRLAVYGFVWALLTLSFLFSGHLPLDAHRFGMVVLGQAIWFIPAGARLCRRETKASIVAGKEVPPN